MHGAPTGNAGQNDDGQRIHGDVRLVQCYASSRGESGDDFLMHRYRGSQCGSGECTGQVRRFGVASSLYFRF